MSVRPNGVRAARVIQVVETTALRGDGIPDDPVREVTQFWSLEGKLLAEHDPMPTQAAGGEGAAG